MFPAQSGSIAMSSLSDPTACFERRLFIGFCLELCGVLKHLFEVPTSNQKKTGNVLVH